MSLVGACGRTARDVLALGVDTPVYRRRDMTSAPSRRGLRHRRGCHLAALAPETCARWSPSSDTCRSPAVRPYDARRERTRIAGELRSGAPRMLPPPRPRAKWMHDRGAARGHAPTPQPPSPRGACACGAQGALGGARDRPSAPFHRLSDGSGGGPLQPCVRWSLSAWFSGILATG